MSYFSICLIFLVICWNTQSSGYQFPESRSRSGNSRHDKSNQGRIVTIWKQILKANSERKIWKKIQHETNDIKLYLIWILSKLWRAIVYFLDFRPKFPMMMIMMMFLTLSVCVGQGSARARLGSAQKKVLRTASRPSRSRSAFICFCSDFFW